MFYIIMVSFARIYSSFQPKKKIRPAPLIYQSDEGSSFYGESSWQLDVTVATFFIYSGLYFASHSAILL